MKRLNLIIITVLTLFSCQSPESRFFPEWMDTGAVKADAPLQRWSLAEDGGIEWNCAEERSLPHYDHIEMAGLNSAALISYGVTAGRELVMQRHLIWPTLRTVPNDTHAHLAHNLMEEVRPQILVDGKAVTRYFPQKISITGDLSFDCLTDSPLSVTRTATPGVSVPGLIEEWSLINETDRNLEIEVTSPEYQHKTSAIKGVQGAYEIRAFTLANEKFTLKPGERRSSYFYMTAATTGNVVRDIDAPAQIAMRRELVEELWGSLVLETPDPVMNRAFQFAKLRASESIFETKRGLMHGPGGASYYAALWTNDQCEYVNPLFPFIGYDIGNDQSVNCYRLYKEYMDEDYNDLITSIIAEGDDIWNGAGDRGDAAMYSYGAARFALAYGDREVAKELWPMIAWGLEYSRRQINGDGVVSSDSDELEGRFPTGDANLCTSSLYYDALISASGLAKSLGLKEDARTYEKQAKELRAAMESFFGANMNGFETYRYFEGNKKLRSWIAIPLTAGIFNRAPGTIDALYSDRLWFGNGMLTEAGDKTFWDRSTLYAFRGALYAGETKKTMKYLADYSSKRLLGEHVPYPVEAWPEGNQKHLSAESGLYCRIFTEGLFGIRPKSLNSFSMIPRLPQGWNKMSLKKVKAFQTEFDIHIRREGDMLRAIISVGGGKRILEHKVFPGETIEIRI